MSGIDGERLGKLNAAATGSVESAAEIVSNRKIWEAAPHNAFTDLMRFRDRWYCAFREGTEHAGADLGVGRILTSADGEHWESVAELRAEGDVRDPKLSITPDGRLMALTAAALYRRQPGIEYPGRDPHQTLAWFSRDGREWGAPVEVGEADWWIWRVTWHKGFAYGVGRRPHIRIPRLYRSADGVRFETWSETLFGAGSDLRGSEASLLFLPDDRALCLIRGRDPAPAQLGRSKPPYREWTWQDLGINIGGPQLAQMPDGRIVVAGRHYSEPRETRLWWLDACTGRLEPFATLCVEYDSSYAGLVFHEGQLWVSYYSGSKTRSSVYLARLNLPPVRG
jgi:hypothetical protein